MTPLRVLSLGCGVQSSTLALMATAGEIEPIDVAIFADTGAEPAAVYRWLEYLRPLVPFPIVTVSAGNLREEILACSRGEQRNDARPPFFVKNPDGSRGILRRQCTQDYKIAPIQAEVRKLIGLKPKQRGPKEVVVEQVIGISWDERIREKRSDKPYIQNRNPLIERRLTRGHCIEWMQKRGFDAPPKSACTFCPYRRPAEWRRLRDSDPEAFEDACRVDEAIRSPGYCGLVGESYISDQLIPLREVDLSNAADHGQLDMQLGMQNECEGMCGL